MTVQPTVDHGQQLASPEGHTIGFVDTKEQFDTVTMALRSAGYDASIIGLHREDGTEMLKRQKKSSSFETAKMPSSNSLWRNCDWDTTVSELRSRTARVLCR